MFTIIYTLKCGNVNTIFFLFLFTISWLGVLYVVKVKLLKLKKYGK